MLRATLLHLITTYQKDSGGRYLQSVVEYGQMYRTIAIDVASVLNGVHDYLANRIGRYLVSVLANKTTYTSALPDIAENKTIGILNLFEYRT